MTIIAVEKECLMQEMEAWRVPMNYVRAFTAKSTQKGGLIGLDPFFFNDTEHLISPRHWLAIQAAFWCCAYCEAEVREAQIEALAGVRAIFYTAGALGVGEITAMIQAWWRAAYPVHLVPAPNHSAAVTPPVFH
ncbi:hypothetical protein [Cronobacter dublinensis]|uniref:hypothetical protein n=1 Tax=Cronobacter dublinensis TaxID=413497 RepID=UPI000CFB76AD|nr:hypothetical protein [Cronobacter dublinensis]